MNRSVYKYGPLEPFEPQKKKRPLFPPSEPQVIIKYGPMRPNVDKYGPLRPTIPEIPVEEIKKLLEGNVPKELKGQIKSCLKRIKAVLETDDAAKIAEGIGPLLAELSLLFLKLGDCLKKDKDAAPSVKPKRQALILYIVMAPMKKPKEKKK